MLEFLAGFLLVAIAASIFAIYQMADKNLFVTTVEEGTAKAVVRGETFVRVLMSWEGHHLNEPGKPWFVEHINGERVSRWDVIRNEDNPLFSEGDDQGLLQNIFGLWWVGFWPIYRVHEYEFEWTEAVQDDEGNLKPDHRKEPTDFIFVKDFPYFILLAQAETGREKETEEGEIEREEELLPVDFWQLLTTRTVNPYKALFGTEDWLKSTAGAVLRSTRNYVGSRSYRELISEVDEERDEERLQDVFSSPILSLNKRLFGQDEGVSLQSEWGIKIVQADPQLIDPPDEFREVTMRRYTAEQDAMAEIALAEGDKKARVLRAEGEAQAIRERYIAVQRFKHGLHIRTLEALEKAGEDGNTVVWANNPFGRLSELFKGK